MVLHRVPDLEPPTVDVELDRPTSIWRWARGHPDVEVQAVLVLDVVDGGRRRRVVHERSPVRVLRLGAHGSELSIVAWSSGLVVVERKGGRGYWLRATPSSFADGREGVWDFRESIQDRFSRRGAVFYASQAPSCRLEDVRSACVFGGAHCVWSGLVVSRRWDEYSCPLLVPV